MNVRYDPGQSIILTSLWVALAGMVITTFGRIRKSNRQGKGIAALNKLTEQTGINLKFNS
ncbi:MAG: hypothetical protein JJE30_05115 [Desulfuromonadales bacterium]|nr:hypothetical protein [Desulfuromonadales bacterium]